MPYKKSFRFPRRRPYGRKPSKKAYKKRTISPVVKKYVKSQIHRNVENKVYIQASANNADVLRTASGLPTNINLLPQLTQDASQSGRVGNEVRVMRGSLNIMFQLHPYNVSNTVTAPCYLKYWIGKLAKQNPAATSGGALPSNACDDMFEAGAISGGFLGDERDLVRTINKDTWTVYKSGLLRLGEQSGSTANIGGYTTNQSDSGMRVSYNLHIPLTKKMLPAKIKYNDNDSYARNANLWMIIQAINANSGTVQQSIIPAQMTYQLRVEYEDA